MEAILYQGQSATWCKGGCNRFRKPHCHVENSPICYMCARKMELQPINKIVAEKTLQSLRLSSKPRQKRTIGSGNLPALKQTRVSDRLLKILRFQPHRSSDLAQILRCGSQYLTVVARNLVREGKIIAAREQSKNPQLWYALPRHREQLEQATRKCA